MKAFFAGSFNPFTIGHLDILARGLRIFPDGVVVGIGYNEHKATHSAMEELLGHLTTLLAGIPGVEVTLYSGLTVEAAREAGARCLLRSFRNATDAEYERTLADANRMVSGMETVLLAARPELGTISSSLVRELKHNGYDTDRFIPSAASCRKACAEGGVINFRL